MIDPTSQELLSRFRNGKSLAADEIFNRYVRRLIDLTRNRISPKLARRVDPEDIVQSAYRSFFVHARDGDFALQRAGDLWRLLASITLNKLHGQIERNTAQRRSITREEDATSVGDGQPAEHLVAAREPTPIEAAEVAEQLEHVMRRATADERQALELRLQGHTIDEIAESIDRSQRTVRRLLANVRRELELQLNAD